MKHVYLLFKDEVDIEDVTQQRLVHVASSPEAAAAHLGATSSWDVRLYELARVEVDGDRSAAEYVRWPWVSAEPALEEGR